MKEKDNTSKGKNLFHGIWTHYERFLVIPIILVILAGVILGVNYQKNGWILKRGIDFSGGTEVTLALEGDVSSAKASFEKIAEESVTMRTLTSGDQKWVSFTSSKTFERSDLENKLKDEGVVYSDLSIRSLGASVSSSFFKQALIAILIAFVLMSIVIFIAFRTVVPSLAAILSVIVDVVITLGLMSLFNIELTLGSLAALLMLIGYSVDTDVLLSTRLIKERTEDLESVTFGAMKTGLTMSITSLMAFLVLFLVSTSATLDSIAIVIVFGLLADIPSTWFQNAVILKNYAKRRIKK